MKDYLPILSVTVYPAAIITLILGCWLLATLDNDTEVTYEPPAPPPAGEIDLSPVVSDWALPPRPVLIVDADLGVLEIRSVVRDTPVYDRLAVNPEWAVDGVPEWTVDETRELVSVS